MHPNLTGTSVGLTRGTSRQCDAVKIRDSSAEERSLRPQPATSKGNITAVERNRPSHDSSGQKPRPRDGGTGECTQQGFRQGRIHDGGVLTTCVYSRQVRTRDGGVLATGVYMGQVCTRGSVDPSSLRASTVDSRQKVVPLKFEVVPVFKRVNACSAVLTTTRPTLLCTPAQAECCRARRGSLLFLTLSGLSAVSCP